MLRIGNGIKATALTTIAALSMIQSCSSTHELSRNQTIESFAIHYGKLTPDQIKPYKTVILEPDLYSKLEVDALKKTGTRLIAYISLGEANKSRWYYQKLQKQGFLGTNKIWNSSYLDLADPATREILLEEVVPEIMIKGFDGLFLDTIDNVAPYTQRANLQPFMVEIIKKLDNTYPEALIIQNAGLFLLEQTKLYVDAILIEDVATLYDFDSKEYVLLSENKYTDRVQTIRGYAKSSNKEFMIVDFGVDREFVKKIKTRLDTLSIPYFISNIELNSLADTSSNQK